MNKKQLILSDAKRLFRQYGYLGFTLKQLARACDITSPALYYFYTSKADLFKDCLLSEISARRTVTLHCIAESATLPEFADILAREAIDVCDQSCFCVGQAMLELIHLPEELRQELRQAWQQQVIAPIEAFTRRIVPDLPPTLPYSLLAIFLLDMAAYSAQHVDQYSRDELAALFIAVTRGLQSESDPAGSGKPGGALSILP